MAHLIDADVFKTEYENLITWVSHRAEKARLREFIKDIQNQPTVKAIPKEWIRDYMLRLPDGSEAYECILVMLENWEKENANNN